MSETEGVLVELDSRKRVPLGKVATYDRYLARVEQDGTIILTPAVVVTPMQAAFVANTELQTRIAEFEANPEAVGVRRRRPSRRRAAS